MYNFDDWINNRVTARVSFKGSKKLYDYFIPKEQAKVFLRELYSRDWHEFKEVVDNGKNPYYYLADDSESSRALVTCFGEQKEVMIKQITINSNTKATRELDKILILEGIDEASALRKAPKEMISPRKETQKSNKTSKGGNTMKFGKMKIKGFENVGMQEGLFGYSLFTQEMAVKMDGHFVAYDKETGALTDVSDFVMEMPIPAMVMPVKRTELKKGDIIFNDGELVFVDKVDANSMTIIKSDGEKATKNKVANALFKEMDFVEKVSDPMEGMGFGTGSGDAAANPFSNPMMMMAFMGDDDGDKNSMKDMMMMMAMSQMFAPKKED